MTFTPQMDSLHAEEEDMPKNPVSFDPIYEISTTSHTESSSPRLTPELTVSPFPNLLDPWRHAMERRDAVLRRGLGILEGN